MSVLPGDDSIEEVEVDENTNPEDVPVIVEDDASSSATPVPDLDPELEREIKLIEIPEEPKAKGHIISEDIINRKLRPEDLYDSGSI